MSNSTGDIACSRCIRHFRLKLSVNGILVYDSEVSDVSLDEVDILKSNQMSKTAYYQLRIRTLFVITLVVAIGAFFLKDIDISIFDRSPPKPLVLPKTQQLPLLTAKEIVVTRKFELSEQDRLPPEVEAAIQRSIMKRLRVEEENPEYNLDGFEKQ